LNSKLEAKKEEAEGFRKSSIEFSTNLKGLQVKYEILSKERPELLDEIDRLRYEYDLLLVSFNKKQTEIEDINKENSSLKARELKYFNELSALKSSFSVEKDELYSTRAKLVELYEHYKLLENRLETKTALCQLSESRERDLQEKIFMLEKASKEKNEEIEKYFSGKDATIHLLNESNKEIEKLLKENEDLRAQIDTVNVSLSNSINTESIEKIICWYEDEINKITEKTPKLQISQNEDKVKSIIHIISTIFTESLVVFNHYEELKLKYDNLLAELNNFKQSNTKDL
jgi:chromosome segregation ATPase